MEYLQLMPFWTPPLPSHPDHPSPRMAPANDWAWCRYWCQPSPTHCQTLLKAGPCSGTPHQPDSSFLRSAVHVPAPSSFLSPVTSMAAEPTRRNIKWVSHVHNLKFSRNSLQKEKETDGIHFNYKHIERMISLIYLKILSQHSVTFSESLKIYFTFSCVWRVFISRGRKF